MEIKTLTEARADRVLVRVQEAEGLTDPRIQVVVTLPGATYDAGAAADVLAGNYQRARAELDLRERQVALMKEAEKGYQFALRELQGQLADEQAARRRVEMQRNEFDHDRHTERDRADGLRESLAKTVAEANTRERRQAEELNKRFTFQQVEDAKANARASEGARIRTEIRGLLNRPGIEQRMEMEQSPGAQELARVIRQIRELLDNPA